MKKRRKKKIPPLEIDLSEGMTFDDLIARVKALKIKKKDYSKIKLSKELSYVYCYYESDTPEIDVKFTYHE